MWATCLRSIASQSLQPDFKLLIDSSSTDHTRDLARKLGFEVEKISKIDFDHGGTRLYAARKLDKADILIYLTQDAVPASVDSFKLLLDCLQKPSVASVYGRQLPAKDASELAVHHRQYNYKVEPFEVTSETLLEMGIKGIFSSNSFAAYRREALLAVGGFSEHLIMGEDMLAAKALINCGYKHVYCAQASVWHSHNLSFMGEFRRYFDTGVFHRSNVEINELLNSTKKLGAGFVLSELHFALNKGPLLFAESIYRNVLRVSAYFMGRHNRQLPRRFCKYLSNSAAHWRRVQP